MEKFRVPFILVDKKLKENRSWILKNFEISRATSLFWIIFPRYKIAKLTENSRWMHLWSIPWYGSIMYLLSFFESWKLMELRMSWVLYKLGSKVVWNVSRIGELSKLLNISICSTSKRSLKSIRNFTKCRGRAAKYSYVWMFNIRENFSPKFWLTRIKKRREICKSDLKDIKISLCTFYLIDSFQLFDIADVHKDMGRFSKINSRY